MVKLSLGIFVTPFSRKIGNHLLERDANKARKNKFFSTIDSFGFKQIFLLSFLYFLIANLTTLKDPPYWDSIMGVFSQAVWLKNNHFDYLTLHHLPGFLEGGPNINILYLMAPIYGLLFGIFSPVIVFLISHFINIACAAMTFSLFYLVLKTWTPSVYALVWCIAGALNPIFSGQCASIYLEMPQTAAYAAVIYSLSRERYAQACCWIILAYFIKSSALIIGLAMFLWFFTRFFLIKWCTKKNDHEAFNAWSLFLLIPLPIFIIFNPLVNASSDLSIKWDPPEMLLMSKMMFPSLVLLGITGVILSILLFIRKPCFQELKNEANRLHLFVFFGFFIYGFIASFFLYRHPLCRYLTAIVFPMMTFMGLQLFSLKYTRSSYIIPVLLIFFYLLNQNGQLLAPMPTAVGRSGHLLERSREFLQDLSANKTICNHLETNYFNESIVTKWPFVQMLTMPEIGYVKRSLPNVYAADFAPIYSSAKRADPIILTNPNTLFLYVANVFQLLRGKAFFPEKGDLLLFKDTTLGAAVYLYKRRD